MHEVSDSQGLDGNSGPYAPLLVAEHSLYNVDTAKINGESEEKARLLWPTSILHDSFVLESRSLPVVLRLAIRPKCFFAEPECENAISKMGFGHRIRGGNRLVT